MIKKLSNCSSVLSMDKRYIIMFGGFDGIKLYDDIFVFDLNKNIIFKSNIKCPENGIFETVIINNKSNKSLLMIYGYINKLNNIKLPSTDILNLIHSMCITEYIYLLHRGIGHHWKIKIDDILNTLYLP